MVSENRYHAVEPYFFAISTLPFFLALNSFDKYLALCHNLVEFLIQRFLFMRHHFKNFKWLPLFLSALGILVPGSAAYAAPQPYSWGPNSYGQLGDESTTARSFPVPISVGPSVVELSVGGSHSLSLNASGSVYAWGRNNFGQIGDGTLTNRPERKRVAQDIVAIAAGDTHSLALTETGRILSWGNSASRRLGRTISDNADVPVEIPMTGSLAGKTFTEIAAGDAHSLALDSNGQIYAWGLDSSGQLGRGYHSVSPTRPVPVRVSGALAGKSIIAIACGGSHSLALSSDGHVFSWGNNEDGQLGNGQIPVEACDPEADDCDPGMEGQINRYEPVAVDTSGALAGKTVTAIAAGEDFSLALTSSGEIFSWGRNWDGQLGRPDNTQDFSNVPVAVDMSGQLSGKTVVAIAAGRLHGLALTSDKHIYRWGASTTYDGYDSNPAVIENGSSEPFENVIAIADGSRGRHCLAIASTNTANEAPTIWSFLDRTIYMNETPALIQFKVYDSQSFPSQLTVTAASSNQTLMPDSNIVLSGIGRWRGISITPATDQIGQTDITVTVSDGDLSSYKTFRVTVVAPNEPPIISDIIDQTITGNQPSVALPFTIGDSQAPLAQLIVSGTSGNQTLIPEENIVFGGTEANRTVTITPATGEIGQTTVTITVSDGSLSASDSFVVTVTAPTIVTPPPGTPGQPFAWGVNNEGQIGDGTQNYASTITAVNTSGALNGKTVVAMAGGYHHSLALTTEGQVYSWGSNGAGQLGNGARPSGNLPGEIDMTGALAGKTIRAIAANNETSLVLASDGRVYGWGLNSFGELGNGTSNSAVNPTAVNMDGALAGKTVTLIAVGRHHSLVLASDGKLYAFGRNEDGELGIGNAGISRSEVPVAVDMSGALAGKTVVAIACGDHHNIVLTSDGKLYSWGSNFTGQLGDGSTIGRYVPVEVDMTGALASETIQSITAGSYQTLVSTRSGKIFSWGNNYNGALGTGGTESSNVPVAVDMSGALAGKVVTTVVAGVERSWALTSDGQVYLCGGYISMLFEGITRVPIPVVAGGALDGKTVVGLAAGGAHGLAIAVAANQPPTITDIADQSMIKDQATSELEFTIGDSDTAAEQLTVSATSSNHDLVPVAGIVFNGTGAGRTVTVAPVIGQTGQATITVTVSDGHLTASDSFVVTVSTPNDPPTISDIADQVIRINNPTGALAFTVGDSQTPAGELTVTASSSDQGLVPDGNIVIAGEGANRTVTVTPTAGQTGQATITLTVSDGILTATDSFILTVESEPIVTPPPGSGSPFAWGIGDAGQLGNGANYFAPVPVAVNTSGVLAGKAVTSMAGGFNHSLALTHTGQVYTWGSNEYGQLGNDGRASGNLPGEIDMSGALAGKTITAIAGRDHYSLVLASDGKVYGWGGNWFGQLGNGTFYNAGVPVAVNTDGALAGKTVVAIAAGNSHALALTSDGQLYSWGMNYYGQTGSGNYWDGYIAVPAAVDMNGALAGKTVVAIACGAFHSVVLTSDGRVYTWGLNDWGALGNGNNETSFVPVEVDMNGALAGQSVVKIAAGNDHTVVATDGGIAYSWGINQSGQLGNGGFENSNVPVAVDMGGVLAGKTVTAVAAGNQHSLALTSDGLAYAWGHNVKGGLGNSPVGSSPVPVEVFAGGALAGTSVSAISAGEFHSFAIAPAGTLVNEAPTITSIPDMTVSKNSEIAFSFTIGDSITPANGLMVSFTSSNQDVINVTNLHLSGNNEYRFIYGNPSYDQTGESTITVTVSDGILSTSESLVVTVAEPNDPPTISDITNKLTRKDHPTEAIAFTVGDSQTAAAQLVVTGRSSDQTLVPDANIVIAGEGENRTVTVTPAPGQSGLVTITLTVSDGSLTAQDTFALTISPDVTPPTITLTSPLNGAFIK